MRRFISSQLMSIFCAIIGVIYIEILVHSPWVFKSGVSILIPIVLAFVYAFITNKYLITKWYTAIIISISYMIYWFMFVALEAKMFPTEHKDLGLGVLALYMSLFHFGSVVIGTVIGSIINWRKR
ncbi:hypothetical protein [Clostridium ganghwense]|uniref:Uncharacterized protein n=1 Tax=Clostridium ganghwense TaxID=312089 RepID=A0ABT4CVD8_9CLOT|nr:hypothetical protein [Clostridium ganghwense]MCY6372176.1 hypothetical protein [Clostridium ganghwense]